MNATPISKICIVNDCKLTRATLKYALNDYNDIEVVAAFENAKICINYLKSHRVDIAILDLDSKDPGKIEAIKIIKRKHHNIKVVVLSSTCIKNEILEAIESGADAYVFKDVDFEELHRIISMIKKGALWFDAKFAAFAKDIFKSQMLRKTEKLSFEGNLTRREKEVLELVCLGLSNTEISQRLIISTHTAKAHVSNIITKLKSKDRVEAAVKACKMGMLD